MSYYLKRLALALLLIVVVCTDTYADWSVKGISLTPTSSIVTVKRDLALYVKDKTCPKTAKRIHINSSGYLVKVICIEGGYLALPKTTAGKREFVGGLQTHGKYLRLEFEGKRYNVPKKNFNVAYAEILLK